MGASDSKLSFKQGIFRLAEPPQIPADDTYWTGVSSSTHTPLARATADGCTATVLGAARVG
jgi:hypothetical protein